MALRGARLQIAILACHVAVTEVDSHWRTSRISKFTSTNRGISHERKPESESFEKNSFDLHHNHEERSSSVVGPTRNLSGVVIICIGVAGTCEKYMRARVDPASLDHRIRHLSRTWRALGIRFAEKCRRSTPPSFLQLRRRGFTIILYFGAYCRHMNHAAAYSREPDGL